MSVRPCLYSLNLSFQTPKLKDGISSLERCRKPVVVALHSGIVAWSIVLRLLHRHRSPNNPHHDTQFALAGPGKT